MNDEDKTGSAPCENSFKSHIMSKPKQWVLSDQTEKFRVFRYEAPEGSESALWVELRWSLKREALYGLPLQCRRRRRVVDSVGRPIKHHAVAKRQAFEAIAWASVPA
jgi:hypothetical protein